MMELFKDKKKTLLTVCICLLAISVLYRLTHIYQQPKVTALTYTGEKTATGSSKIVKKDIAATAETSMINLDLFINPRPHSRDVKRDIFSGHTAAAELGKPAGGDQKSTIQEGETQTPNPEDQIKDDLSTFKSFGYAERGGEKILFIEKGKQIMLVRKGDRIEGKYIVKDLNQRELTLLVIANNEIVHIDLSQL
jgi:hypothetical protein